MTLQAVNPYVVACNRCVHFEGAPQALEREIPGLRTLGSGFAAVVGDDGICAHHQRLVAARACCAQFAPRVD